MDLQPLNVQKVLVALGKKKYKLAGEIAMVWGLASLGHTLHVRGICLPCFQFTFADTFL